MTSRPESRLNAKFINGLNETADIVTKNLAQDFVNLRCRCLALETFAKLRLNHAERRLNI